MNKKIIILSTILVIFIVSPAHSVDEPDFKKIRDSIKQEKIENQKSIEYENWLIQHRKRVFNFQHTASILIFVVVLIIVFIGLYFSFIQFRNSIRKEIEIPSTSIKIGKDGIEISSSIVGLLTLIVSLAFFYLYLEKVYPINVINLNQQSSKNP